MLMKGLPDPAQAGGNPDLVLTFANEKNGQKFATVPVAVFFDRSFNEIHRYIEYPAIYHKARVIGHLREASARVAAAQTTPRGCTPILALLESPVVQHTTCPDN